MDDKTLKLRAQTNRFRAQVSNIWQGQVTADAAADGVGPRRLGARSTRDPILGQAHIARATGTSHPGVGYGLIKRALDVSACVIAAPIVVPLTLICALAVRLSSPGPVFFKQDRIGLGGRPFKMLKFRSMVVDAEDRKCELKRGLELTGPDFKLKNDPRVTRVGAFLRKTSLDELPQLWNVLRGDMSLVGPRPTSFGMDTYSRWHAERLEVKPGLTGFWQIKARGDLDFDRRVRMDIAYVRQRSLLLDCWILLCTLPCVLRQHGAY